MQTAKSIACVALLTGLASCSVTAPGKTKEQAPVAASGPIDFVGRVELTAPGTASYAWSGAGFVARFRGTGAVVRLRDDKNEHQVIIDGKPGARLVTRANEERYVAAEGLPPGEHRIEVHRLTEALFGKTQFLGLEILQGELLENAASPKRRIEVVGDSISCGYGNEGQSPDCPFSPATENHYLSYGALLARSLGASLSTVAWSGRGVVKNYDGGAGEKMGVLYDRVLPEEPKSGQQPKGDFDAVLVNLGTNDFSTDPDPAEDDFVSAYVELLTKIRSRSPRALILCTIGPMLGGDKLAKAQRAITKAVEVMKAKGESSIVAYHLKTDNQNPGCDWHPGLATHRQMADELALPLKAQLGWQ